MSRFDAAHERQWAEQEARDALSFTVGATVYRHHFGLIEQGVVVIAGRCNDPDHGENPDGKRPYYAAMFVRSPGCSPHWEAQTFSWKFVATREEAAKQLATYLRTQIENKQREIDALNRKLAAVQRGEVVVLLEGKPVPSAAEGETESEALRG